ncbi:Hypothetical_protein [Hexamita inflata]|uniref:Hypothetical_protein n=1 Tax=Hexamita inflata TaxID=28002 RepID=A0AA86RF84_9EUKA|nr:Hypothetical protein HINF_LOCUS59542 [Hexamita inflata]
MISINLMYKRQIKIQQDQEETDQRVMILVPALNLEALRVAANTPVLRQLQRLLPRSIMQVRVPNQLMLTKTNQKSIKIPNIRQPTIKMIINLIIIQLSSIDNHVDIEFGVVIQFSVVYKSIVYIQLQNYKQLIVFQSLTQSKLTIEMTRTRSDRRRLVLVLNEEAIQSDSPRR